MSLHAISHFPRLHGNYYLHLMQVSEILLTKGDCVLMGATEESLNRLKMSLPELPINTEPIYQQRNRCAVVFDDFDEPMSITIPDKKDRKVIGYKLTLNRNIKRLSNEVN